MAELTTLARPYAKAAFERAREADALAEWGDMLALAAAIVEDDSVADRIIGNPLVDPEDAAAFVGEVAGDRFSDDFNNLVRLMAGNRRLALLPEVTRLYARFRAQAEQTLDVEVTTAVEAPEGFRERLADALKRRFKREISVALTVDGSLLGGAVVRAGDTVMDGSLRGKLNALASEIGR